nr:hypothetical protein [Hassalia byssoidea]
MMTRDIIFCLQEAALEFIFQKSFKPKNPSECFINPDCGCKNPGKELKCEDCPDLEACLSGFKNAVSSRNNIKYQPSDGCSK